MKKIFLFSVFLFVLILNTVLIEGKTVQVQIDGQVPGIIPEGIEYVQNQFLLSSLADGKIYAVSALDQDGDSVASTREATVYINGNRDGWPVRSSSGLHVVRNRLYIAGSSFPPAQQAHGYWYDNVTLPSPASVGWVGNADFTPFFAVPEILNDVVVSPKTRTAYYTASNEGMIMQVLGSTTFNDVVSVLDASELYKPGPVVGVGANGIELYEDGEGNEHLIVCVSGEADYAKLVRVPVKEPELRRQIMFVDEQGNEVGENLATGCDGIHFDGGYLYVASNALGVSKLSSWDGWHSAQLVERVTESVGGDNLLTTITTDDDGRVWGLFNGNFDATKEVYIQSFDFQSSGAKNMIGLMMVFVCVSVVIIFG
mmetsp:Transcript_19222/g.28612  ORF Transcript_19222/g.28612 Transcript_19222/m.28612 type:complete len:370 (+) Transcript_19222:77-1186(+)|eukprot:CAMPEP_0201552364 /NCGR_PEP_ID=MMETSP0173_2-20130828/15379_1 /ASSEMBLY_ACC=CAM_ASM_000268 /TAXON_ID=218659 /ORGANISM="Vexillifera sp., Strain DIVA3 564/2" /LENGTH=369 /DNA_ID=CAMNT_0047962837 /DNA_START=53 /DNA_END=1162 /DNA_ORIENTATION=+